MAKFHFRSNTVKFLEQRHPGHYKVFNLFVSGGVE